MGESQQTVEQTDGSHMPCAIVNGSRGLGENTDQFRRKYIGQHTHQLCHDQGAGDAKADAFFHPVVLPCAQILSREGAQALAEAHHRQEGEAFQLGIGAATVDGIGAKGENVGLHHHIGQGNNGILNGRGQTVADDLLQAVPVEADLFQIQTGRTLGTHQVDAAEQRADALGNGGSQCGSAHAKTHYTHEQKIQHDIHCGGTHQIVKRMLAVAHGMVNTHENIVHHREDSAAEIKTEIGDGVYHRVCGNAHPAEDDGGAGSACDGQGSAGAKTKGDGGVDGLADGSIIFCAVVPGDHHTGAHGQTIEKADHQEDQRTGTGDSAHGVVVDKIADAPGIKCIVQLLENLTEEDGESKQQNRFPNGPLGEGYFLTIHFIALLSVRMALLYALQVQRSRRCV